MHINDILKQLPVIVSGHQRVVGGDINECYYLETSDKKYFLKLNDSNQFPGMFRKEAAGLKVLKDKSHIIIPEVITEGEVSGQQYLMLEWLNENKIDAMEDFGKLLAEMHRKPQLFFGWHEDNYIGSLPQQNKAAANWAIFYSQSRIMPLVVTLRDRRLLNDNDVRNAETLCNRLQDLFPEEPPSLLHGDLWGGNYMVTGSGVSIFDPAVYFGHREMDIGMTKLFGGFDQQFYDGYNSTYPLQPGWMERLPLTQLYPLLVHAILFGGSYVERVKSILKRYS